VYAWMMEMKKYGLGCDVRAHINGMLVLR